MITGTLDNWKQHLSGPVWEKAFNFIAALPAAAADGKTLIEGNDMFAIVGAYDTHGPEGQEIETHRKNIDIQVMMSGTEGIEWFPRPMLEVKTPYDEEKDAAFYSRPVGPAPAYLTMVPGRFAIFFPDDGHMCQLVSGGKVEHVKKVVIKIRLDLVK